MSKEDHIELNGEVVDCGKGGNFIVKITEEHEVVAKLSGKMRKNKIRVVLGDQVVVKVSHYDPNRGFITTRSR